MVCGETNKTASLCCLLYACPEEAASCGTERGWCPASLGQSAGGLSSNLQLARVFLP